MGKLVSGASWNRVCVKNRLQTIMLDKCSFLDKLFQATITAVYKNRKINKKPKRAKNKPS